jgi:nicotinate dehydrogenase subunit B
MWPRARLPTSAIQSARMRISVNGEQHEVSPAPARGLLHVLREELGLVEAKYGCGEGECGACTVLLDGEPVRACITPLDEADGRAVVTLEGLDADSATCRLAAAFAEHRVAQCGYCVPGMLVSATALLHHTATPSDADIVTAMDGNICRCGTYGRITRAISAAAAAAGDGQPAPTLGATTADARRRPQRPWDLTEPAERDWFDLLGDGLVVVLTPQETERLAEMGAAGWSTPGGAWLHVAVDGRITACSGKVDVGQRNRAALATLVAAEMDVAPERVTLLMGDTDLTPFDLGTFGSRSMADAGLVLRTVAAGACQALAELGQPRAGMRVLREASADSATSTNLADRLAAMPRRPAAPRAAAYASDLTLPGMLHGRVLRPPAYAARLVALDTSAAEATGGVSVVHDGDFVGVAAADPLAAGQALRSIGAEWRREAELPAEAELAAYLRSHPRADEGWQGSFERRLGQPQRAFERAAHRLSATYTTAYIAHLPLEARVALADVDAAGRLTIWTGTQRPFPVRQQVAQALGMSEADVRVIVAPTGSGYGGKHSGEAAVEAARLARATGRPVKVRWRRSEEFSWAYFRPAAVIDVEAALDADGQLTGWRQVNVNSGPNAIATPYEVANVELAYRAAESPLRQGSWRALAASANNFARESMIDELAHAAGVDPLEFRLRHLADARLAAVLSAAAERAGWPAPRAAGEGERVGLGVACGLEKDGRIASVAQVVMPSGGTPIVERIVSAYDCGLIVDRDNLANQVEGAAVMGLSAAMFEAIHFADGRLTNAALADYRVARFSDAPQVEAVLIDRPNEPSAGGGETPIIAIAPAIANAIFAASGRRLRSLPLREAW